MLRVSFRRRAKKGKESTGLGGCTLPHEPQKWTARMVPHDQQLAVASAGSDREEAVLDSIVMGKSIACLFALAYSAVRTALYKPFAGEAPAPHTIAISLRTKYRIRRTSMNSGSRTRSL